MPPSHVDPPEENARRPTGPRGVGAQVGSSGAAEAGLSVTAMVPSVALTLYTGRWVARQGPAIWDRFFR